MNNIPIEKTKRPREKKPKFTVDQRLDNLEKWRENVGEELRNLQTIKEGLAEFVFQTIAIVVGLFAIFITVILSSTIQWSLDSEVKYKLLIGILIVLAIILSIWLYLWHYLHFRRKKG